MNPVLALRQRGRALVAATVGCALLLAAATALASVPPLKVAAARQASLRHKAKKGGAVDLSVTVTAGSLTSYQATGLSLGHGNALTLAAPGGQTSLSIGPAASFPWKVVWALLSSTHPLADIQKDAGTIDAAHARIDTIDGHFVYVYGSLPQIALSRDFSHIRVIRAHAGGNDWEFRLSGDLGVAGLPERINIVRAGEPYASVELARPDSKHDQH